MLRWLRSLFAWRFVRTVGGWEYHENAVTGQRSAAYYGGGHQPLDLAWLEAGTGHPIILNRMCARRVR